MGTFHLTRYFSTLSFVLIVLSGGALDTFLQRQGSAQLNRMAEDRNVAMTQVFRNALWQDFAPLVNNAAGQTPDILRKQVTERGLLAKTATLMRDSEAIKVKVYNLEGLTVFSSDPKQIGEGKLTNPGFIAATAGNVASELTHRNQFDAFEKSMSDIDVISSYVPILDQGRLVGVFEVYQDVTPFVLRLEQAKWWVWLTVLGVLGTLYLAQLLVVRRAQAIMRLQADELVRANRDLDQRVQARTAELQAEVHERRNAEARLDHLAHHDPLTSLPNRLMFTEHLKKSISNAARGERRLAVLFIDLDRFKEVNDTLGHAFGDKLLVEVTHRLVTRLRAGDTLARIGGDEFICILEDIKDAAEAGYTADKLIELLVEPFQILEHELYIDASIGICIYPADGEDVDTLVRNADTAMYQAKEHGRGRSHFYTAEMTTYAQERVRIESLLRRAIDAGELEVHYQIKVAGVGGKPVGAEALVRWNSAELGRVPPVRFIPLAEETGFIVTLGEWVLQRTCRQMMAWRQAGLAMPKVSVNVSVKQLEHGNIVQTVQRILAETGLEPAALELEITESVIMNIEDALDILKQLSLLGIQLSIDDFGTGYSSLAYLKLLPINTLKIDRAFVTGIGENSGDEAIIRAVIALARSLNLHTVAEGVETTRQLDFLSTHGADEIQGYLFGKPQPADEFAENWRTQEGK
jgi:diguanylate cyclase (GGDEF)-like protein